ncbi:MAG: ABC transporter ATP-binding protein [Terrimicrobiaceae bacterium]|nr:ABC transporter ATP-binding protein [Terrimicrobiaceae bacterium]
MAQILSVEGRPQVLANPGRLTRMIAPAIDLPDYRQLAPEVAARFERIRKRPVILKVHELEKTFGEGPERHVVFDHVSLDIHRREFLTVIGPSGCGKSTLVRIVAGLEEATSGEVFLDEHAVSAPGPDRGMVFQGYTLFPWLTVKRNVMFGLEMRGKSTASAQSEARSWIDMVGLAKFENSYPHELSGGMKQRVAIARALANEPRILLMDEPFGALDSLTRCKMQSYLLQIWKKVDVTILFITHDLDEAIYLSDRILVLGTNPGGVREVIENPVPRPRSPDQAISPEYLALKTRLDELIHGTAEETEEEKLPMARMTLAGDDVE